MMRTAGLAIATWFGSMVAAAIVLAIGAALSGKTAQEGERAMVGIAIALLVIVGGAFALTLHITRDVSSGKRILTLVVFAVAQVALLAVCALGALVAFNR